MTRLPDAEVKALLELAERATPRPWTNRVPLQTGWGKVHDPVLIVSTQPESAIAHVYASTREAAFIVGAVNALPDALREIQEARSLLAWAVNEFGGMGDTGRELVERVRALSGSTGKP